MNRGDFILKCPGSGMDWIRIRLLYRFSFPASERKPFRIIRRMYADGKADVICAYESGAFVGFYSTINGERLVLLDYLAVRKKKRSCGAGSHMLSHFQNAYEGCGVFVEIENAFENCKNREERLRRRNFYIKNGMKPMNVLACVFGVNMELLGTGAQIDFETYRSFYRDNYSEFAAKNIVEAAVPQGLSVG